MVIFMAGYPFAGKTLTVNKIISHVESDNTIVINLSPKFFYNSTINDKGIKEKELSEAARTEIMVSSWECSLEKLKEFIEECSPNDIIIYDSCCASSNNMLPYFNNSKECGHRIIFILVNCKLSICKSRDENMPNSTWDNYTKKFKSSIPILSKASDDVIIIDNNKYNEDIDISKVLEVINANRIC